MLDHYPVIYCGYKVGTLTLKVLGLYCRYSGVFQIDANNIYRIYAISPFSEQNLGVCIPSEGKWSIQGTIATNKLNMDQIHFEIRTCKMDSRFIPLIESEPFEDLENLLKYKFCRRGEQIGFLRSSND